MDSYSRCARCNKDLIKDSKEKIVGAGNTLFIHLNRVDATDPLRPTKIHTHITIPPRVTFDKIDYTLRGVIHHEGAVQAGHYYVFLKLREKGKWFKCDGIPGRIKESIEVVSEDIACNSTEGEHPSGPYVLFYRKVA